LQNEADRHDSMDTGFARQDSNDRRNKHGYGEVEAANEGIVPGRCFGKIVVGKVV
jgi:hypothetical protein